MTFNDIKGILFDYGGTIDSRAVHWSEVIRLSYEHAGLHVADKQFREAYVETERELARKPHIKPHHTFLYLMRKKIGIELASLENTGAIEQGSAKCFTEPIAQYCYNYAAQCCAEARPILAELHNRYPMALVTNFYGNIRSVIADFGIADCFDTIVESAVVGIRKPHPAIFRLGAEALGLEPRQTVVVGDSLSKDIIPAASIGCATIYFEGTEWEDDRNTSPIEPGQQFAATLTIHSLAEAAKALL